ncbi:hypothetical protein G9F71_008970 [Clostridium sp. FP2]|uniref:hypothetical protein n=1 Tax=Clostridium sp. FP2 TaxID=2724481 RepID=UPI0013E93B08|nr:hypothetical protein [Clostridium sp. FP2]MBZ9622986.1 hypothetical protein [Clostridium sp. FP2]
MVIVGEQIFIRVKGDKDYYDKDIRDSSYEERLGYYNTLSKGQVVSMLELCIKNNIK